VIGASLLCNVSTGVPQNSYRGQESSPSCLIWPGPRQNTRQLAAGALQGGVAQNEFRCGTLGQGLPALLQMKGDNHPASPGQPNKEVQPFICVDLLGPLPDSKSRSTYILTLVHGTSRLLEAILLRTVEASVCADVFINMWVASYFIISFSIQYWCVNLCHRLPRVMSRGTCVG